MDRGQGCFKWGEPLLFHEALHILQHDDGIVDDDADRDDHRKEG